MSPFQRHHYPALPASLSTRGAAIQDYYAAQLAAHPRTNQAPYVTPYLGLRARLSQIWINRWTILLFLVLVRTLLAISSLDDGIDSARREALSACTSVESMGSAMASMPHYMSQGVNELTAKGIESSVNGLMSMLELTVTGVEEMVVFIVNLLTQTYLCLITLAIRGSLGTVIGAAKEITEFLDEAVGEIGEAIKSGADEFEDGVNKLVEGLNSIPQLFGSDSEIPTIDFGDDLDKLENLELPKGIEEGLDKLNASIPTFGQVNNLTNSALRLPFEQVKKLINETMVEYKFNRSTFPVPQKEQISFCSDANGIDDFFDSLSDLASTARKIFIAVIVVLAVLVCIPMAYREIKRWHVMQRRAQLISNEAYDPQDVVYIASRPTSSTIGIKLANRAGSLRNQTLIRWAIAYATSTPALFVLTLGITGLFACLCQFILLRSVEEQVPELTEQVGAFAEKVVAQLDGASQQWAVGANDAIRLTSDELNDEIFGWVKVSSTGLNDTLNTFVDEMMGTLNDTFGDTPLYEPITEVLNCLILLKIEGIQKGLTWVSENARISFPELPADTFTLGALASIGGEDSEFGDKADSFLASPSSAATDDISAALARLTQKIESGIRQEALISTVILFVWLLVALIGIGRSTMLFFSREKTRGEGGGISGGQTYAADPMTESHRGFDTGSTRNVTNVIQRFPSHSSSVSADNTRAFPPDDNNNDSETENENADLGMGGLPNYAAAIRSNHHHTADAKAAIGPGPGPGPSRALNFNGSSSSSNSSNSSGTSNLLPEIPTTSTFSPRFHAFAASTGSGSGSASALASSSSAAAATYNDPNTYPPEKSIGRGIGVGEGEGEKVKVSKTPLFRVDTAVTKPNLLRASSYADCLSTSPGVAPSGGGVGGGADDGAPNAATSTYLNYRSYGLPANPYPSSSTAAAANNPYTARAVPAANYHNDGDMDYRLGRDYDALSGNGNGNGNGNGHTRVPPMLIAGVDPFAG